MCQVRFRAQKLVHHTIQQLDGDQRLVVVRLDILHRRRHVPCSLRAQPTTSRATTIALLSLLPGLVVSYTHQAKIIGQRPQCWQHMRQSQRKDLFREVPAPLKRLFGVPTTQTDKLVCFQRRSIFSPLRLHRFLDVVDAHVRYESKTIVLRRRRPQATTACSLRRRFFFSWTRDICARCNMLCDLIQMTRERHVTGEKGTGKDSFLPRQMLHQDT